MTITKQCATCISRRIGSKGCLKCSLNLDQYIGENEVCGSYIKGKEIDDYNYEFDGIYIDDINEKWLSGEII